MKVVARVVIPLPSRLALDPAWPSFMTTDLRQPKPRGFGLFSRIVYVHQAILLAFFLAGLRVYPARGIDELVLPHWLGILLSSAVVIAMFGVATRASLKALKWLRLILWIGVIKILVVQLWLLAQGQTELVFLYPRHGDQRGGCHPACRVLVQARSQHVSRFPPAPLSPLGGQRSADAQLSSAGRLREPVNRFR